jgi:hypothetical protein
VVEVAGVLMHRERTSIDIVAAAQSLVDHDFDEVVKSDTVSAYASDEDSVNTD